MAENPSRFWVIMHPPSGGKVVAKFDTAGTVAFPDEVFDYDDFVIVEVADRSGLKDKTIDQSGLSEDERDLLFQVYSIRS